MSDASLPTPWSDPLAPDWAPPEFDTSRPHPARMYDYYLGGKDNFPVDREAAERMIEATRGNVLHGVRSNRAFLARSVRWLAQQGVDQFLDIGTGIPTQGNTHEIAQGILPHARVVYVDNDPIVLAHSRALLAGSSAGRTTAVLADLREPESFLDHPQVRATLDFERPMAVVAVGMLMFLTDEEGPQALMRTVMDATAAGSHLVLTHVSQDFEPELAERGARTYDRASATMTMRTRDRVAAFVEGLDLVEPGLVQVDEWRPDGPLPLTADLPGGRAWAYGAVARKP
jgi:hypothetical protein